MSDKKKPSKIKIVKQSAEALSETSASGEQIGDAIVRQVQAFYPKKEND